MNRILTAFSTSLLLVLTGCNGIMSGIYDEPDSTESADFGFLNPSNQGLPGTIYIDATSYTDWTYIDFANKKIETVDVEADAPQTWDIAVHRYDVKTNGGKVLETQYAEFDKARTLIGQSTDGYVADVWTTEKIVIDMSTMMDGYLGYIASDYNAELSKWLDVDTSTMPPIYTPSDKVYLIKLKNGSLAAVKLADYMDSAGVKGFMTIQYIYPFE